MCKPEYTIVLMDDEGNEITFEFLDLITVEEPKGQETEYVVLLPHEDDDDMSEVVILELIESDDETEEDTYASVDDDTLMKVFDIFKDRNSDLYDFVD